MSPSGESPVILRDLKNSSATVVGSEARLIKALVPVFLVIVLTGPVLADPPAKDSGAPKPKVPLGKDTTYVNGPLDKDGYVDNAAALNERVGKGMSVDNNAAVLIWRATGRKLDDKAMPATFFKLMGMEVPPAKGDYFVGLRPFLQGRMGIPDWKELERIEHQLSGTIKGPWVAKDFPEIAEWLKANEKPLALAVEASKRQRYFAPVVLSQTESGTSELLLSAAGRGCWMTTGMVRALTCRAMGRLAEGRADEAWQDLLASHRLGRLVAQGANPFDAFCGLGADRIAGDADIAFLGDPRITAKQLQSSRKDLKELRAMPTAADMIDIGSRFIYLDSLQHLWRGDLGDKSDGGKQQSLSGLDPTPAMQYGNLSYDRLVAALRLTVREARLKEIRKFEDDYRILKLDKKVTRTVAKGIGIALLGETLPAYDSSRFDVLEQAHRNLQIAFALATFQRDHKRYPKALSDLAPKYLDKIPDDLFTGQPLVYRPTEKGFLLYSFGPNGKDNEGRGPDDDPMGDDIGVRVPVVPGKR
jgi:hypothetical protein